MRSIGVLLQERRPQAAYALPQGEVRPRSWHTLVTIKIELPLGVAGPGADHAFLAAEFVAFACRLVERTGNFGFDRVTVGTAGIGHVDRQRGTGAFHGQRGAFALAAPAGHGPRRLLGCIVVGLAIGAALADRECAGRP